MPYDGPEEWEHINLRLNEQRAYYEDLLEKFPLPPFPARAGENYRYFKDNEWFCPADAFTLSGIVRRERPARIVEVGSGFSSAVVLDTLGNDPQSTKLTFVEPHPERLYSLLSPADKQEANILVKKVQDVPLATYDALEAQDILFIDSSHVAKLGSDVAFVLLRILPRLKPGVIVHFHDIFYPSSYPIEWIREGRAWNETTFLKAFLVQNNHFEIMAFNPYAACMFPEIFRGRFDDFLANPGGSIWLRKIA